MFSSKMVCALFIRANSFIKNMRFEYYKILTTTSHVGFPFKKNLLLQGAITGKTYIGYIERVAFYHKVDWKPFFLGSYILALVFLYGGHVHLINTKKEWTGILKDLFEKFQKSEKNILSKNGMEWIGHKLLYSECEEDIKAFRELYDLEQKKQKNLKKKKTFVLPKKKKETQKAEQKDAPQKRLPRKIRKKINKKKNYSKSFKWKGSFRLFLKKKIKKKDKKWVKVYKKKLSYDIRTYLKERKNIRKPIITVHDSGFLPGSISNWTEHVQFSNQYLSVPKQYSSFFTPYKKLNEDFIQLKNQSIGIFPLKNAKKSNPIPRKKPDIIMVLNAGNEYGILFESFRESRPVFGAVNTFTKKEWIDFPFDGNDTSLYSMFLWCRWLTVLFQYAQLRRFKKKKFFFKPFQQKHGSVAEDLFDSFVQSDKLVFLKNIS